MNIFDAATSLIADGVFRFYPAEAERLRDQRYCLIEISLAIELMLERRPHDPELQHLLFFVSGNLETLEQYLQVSR